MKYKCELELAKKAAIDSGEYLLHQDAKIQWAENKDIKLENDKASEEIIVNRLIKTGIPIISEESDLIINREPYDEAQKNKSLLPSLCWVVDPLDGSANYWKGMKDLSCVSIALLKDGNPILGVVNRYFNSELFHGYCISNDQRGAWLNEESISCSCIKKVKDGVLATGFPLNRSYSLTSLNSFVRNVQNFKKIRALGAGAIMETFVACGRIDAYIEENIMIWDIAAASAIVLGASGLVKIEMNEDYKCNCSAFASNDLYVDYLKSQYIRENGVSQ